MSRPRPIAEVEAMVDVAERWGVRGRDARDFLREVGYLPDRRPAS